MDESSLLKFLEGLKEFLGEHTTLAFLTLSVALNMYLFRGLLREKDAKFALVAEWLPMVDDMTKLLAYAARKARSSKNASSPLIKGDDL